MLASGILNQGNLILRRCYVVGLKKKNCLYRKDLMAFVLAGIFLGFSVELGSSSLTMSRRWTESSADIG